MSTVREFDLLAAVTLAAYISSIDKMFRRWLRLDDDVLEEDL
jgi:hypothetical protein